MANALVIHAETDINWVLHPLIGALSSLGFTAWMGDWANNESSCHVVLVVVSAAASRSEEARNGADAALASGKPIIPVMKDDTSPKDIALELGRRITADFRKPFPEAYRELSQVIPAIDPVGPLPNSTAPTTYGQRFYGHPEFQQMVTIVDLLRNENPVRVGWYEENPNLFHLITDAGPVSE